MFDALADNWAWLVAAETALLVWSFTRPSLKWELIYSLLGGVDLQYTAGRPGEIWVGKLGRQPKGVTVRFTLNGNEANVRLVDSRGFRRMQKRKKYAYVGGHYMVSPVDLVVPWTGRWYVVADLGGQPGRLTGTWTTLTHNLPPGNSVNPRTSGLATIRRLPGERPAEERDVFISYAGADRSAVAQPLADSLIQRGMSVWIDTYELRVGDSLMGKINEGITASRFGVVVLSPAFLDGPWPMHELGAFFARQVQEQFILPIWHDITAQEVLRKLPLLADRIALSTGQYTIAEIAEQIGAVVQQNPMSEEVRDES